MNIKILMGMSSYFLSTLPLFGVNLRWKQKLLPPFQVASTASATPMNKGIQRMGGSVEATCDITLLLRNMCHQRKKGVSKLS